MSNPVLLIVNLLDCYKKDKITIYHTEDIINESLPAFILFK